MQKKKKLFLYGAILFLAVALILVVIYAVGKTNDAEQAALHNNLLAEKISELEKEADDFRNREEEYISSAEADKKKIQELEEKLDASESGSPDDTAYSENVTMAQALSDMKDIYAEYKNGNVEAAKDLFEKIEPMGFDDATLAYYELLKDILK